MVGKIAVGILRSEDALSLNFRTEPRLGTARESIPRLSPPSVGQLGNATELGGFGTVAAPHRLSESTVRGL